MARVSGVLLAVMTLLILTEIALWNLFEKTTLIADEYSGYFLVAVVLMGLAYALKQDAHIRVEVIRTRLGQKGKSRVDAGCTLLGLVLTIYAIYHAVLMAKDAYLLEMTADSISETPLFLPQLMIPLGLILFALQLIATFIRRLR